MDISGRRPPPTTLKLLLIWLQLTSSVISLHIVISSVLLVCTVYVIQVSAHQNDHVNGIDDLVDSDFKDCNCLSNRCSQKQYLKCVRNWILPIINTFRLATWISDQWRKRTLLGGWRLFPTFSTQKFLNWNLNWFWSEMMNWNYSPKWNEELLLDSI